ncbi:MAG: ATP-binding protein [Bdellovibrionota bacterium]
MVSLIFGPRGTGKSTWLKQQFKPDLTINLLLSSECLAISGDHGLLRRRTEALPRGSKVVIDEIQKLPELLDEVHALIADHNGDYQFALTGSSARRLKRGGANLLAGRAVKREMFGLTSAEIEFDFEFDDLLRFGCLPLARTLQTSEQKADYLYSYVDMYLKEEIQQEAAVRNLSSYHRYLKHAALVNAQVLNASGISRDAAVARATVDGYFSIVEDTLLGSFLNAIQFKAKVKEVANPKFYFFDCGVVRALQGELDVLDSSQRGFLFETFILNEVRAYQSYSQIRGELGYWGTPGDNEVDLIWLKGRRAVGIEIKTSNRWKSDFGYGLKTLIEAKKINSAFGIYWGKDRLKDGPITVLPAMDFLKKLHRGEILY